MHMGNTSIRRLQGGEAAFKRDPVIFLEAVVRIRNQIIVAVFACAALVNGAHGQSASAGEQEPSAIRKLNECRVIADDRARLACFDTSSAELAAARESGAVAVVDRQQVRRAKRGLFGFNLSGLDIFGIGKNGLAKSEQDEVSEISGRISAVTRNADGYYIITIEDGARWEQISPLTFGRAPRAGSTVTIKRAALGSYKMRIDQNPPVKARRVG